MPGSSVSACHLCHLHSHNHDSLVRTSPLRGSRGRTKSSAKYSGHRQTHSNGGYNSSREEPHSSRALRSTSASALARLTDNSHSLPGSRSNSLSRYHREVSTMPGGGDTYGVGMRSSSSTRSLELNPTLPALLDARTTSLPRVSTILHSQPVIHPQPDILVSAMPRSRSNSRSGSLSRNAVNMSQDNSHDYYLDIHRQRFKEERKKQRFNLQTVMLIGCYSLLIVIAIVVGVVLCYQNGWFGLGPPQDKIFGDDVSNANSSLDLRDIPGVRGAPDNRDFANAEVRTRLNSGDSSSPSANLNVDATLTNNKNRGNFGVASGSDLRPQILHSDSDVLSNQRNSPQDHNRNLVRPDSSGLLENNANIRVTNFPRTPEGTHLTPRLNSQLIKNNQDGSRPGTTEGFVPLPPSQTFHVLEAPVFDSRFPLDGRNVHSKAPPVFQAGVPLDLSLSGNPNDHSGQFLTHTGIGNVNSDAISHFSNSPTIRKGNVDSNTVAKTLLQAQIPSLIPPQNPTLANVPNKRFFVLNTNEHLQHKNTNTNPQTHSTFASGNLADATSDASDFPMGSDSLTTQELLDILAIRRMRDLLNSEGNSKTLLELLRKVEPSENSRLEVIKEEKVSTPSGGGGSDEALSPRRGSGRSIKGVIGLKPNSFQIQELIEALRENSKANTDPKIFNLSLPNEGEESSTQKAGGERISESLNRLINNTINGAIIRLLNRDTKNEGGKTTPDFDFDISGISVFPLSGEDLRLLLESSPSNVKEAVGSFSDEKLRSLQILHRIIELNNMRNKVHRHISSQKEQPVITDKSTPDSIQEEEFQRASTTTSIARIGLPSPGRRSVETSPSSSRNRNNPTVVKHNWSKPRMTSRKRNVTRPISPSHFTNGRSQSRQTSPSRVSSKAVPKQPDPSFAVMVRTDELKKSNVTSKTQTPPPVQVRPAGRARNRDGKPFPIRERVEVQPGRKQGRGNSAVIRSWTHMDSSGTFSRGSIHSDGSFAFTNCRPIEICHEANVPVNPDNS